MTLEEEVEILRSEVKSLKNQVAACMAAEASTARLLSAVALQVVSLQKIHKIASASDVERGWMKRYETLAEAGNYNVQDLFRALCWNIEPENPQKTSKSE